MANNEAHQIKEQSLEETDVENMEEADENTRKESWFKEKSALLVVLTAGDKPDSFIGFNRRLNTVFANSTSDHQLAPSANGQPNQRPIISRKEDGLTTWQYATLTDEAHGSCINAMVHMLLSDASNVFAQYATKIGYTTVEVPCFLEMARYSPPNNINNFPALMGEYIALIAYCLHKKHFADSSEFWGEEQKFDFKVRRKGTKIEEQVSVKSVNLKPVQHFYKAQIPCAKPKAKDPHKKPIIGFVNKNEGANVLLHNCECSFCKMEPVMEVEVNPKGFLKGLQKACTSKDKLKKILEVHEGGFVYLVSVRLLFELRYALGFFSQKVFRGKDGDFKLRDFICEYLKSSASETQEWMSTLVGRSTTLTSFLDLTCTE